MQGGSKLSGKGGQFSTGINTIFIIENLRKCMKDMSIQLKKLYLC